MKPVTFWKLLFVPCTFFGSSSGVNYQSYNCPGSSTTGDAIDGSHTEGPDVNLGFNYVAEDPHYTFECCGVVTEWVVVPGKEGTIQLQVWRRLSDNSYKMIGENYCIITAVHITAGSRTCTVDDQDQIMVQKGDFIGWHSNGEEILKYKSEDFTLDNYSGLFRREKPISSSGTGDLYPGELYDWSDAKVYNDRDYGIQATYVASVPPTITALSTNIDLPDYNINSATITRFLYSDADVADNSTLTKYLTQSAPFFNVDPDSGKYLTQSAPFFNVDQDSGFVTGAAGFSYRNRPSTIGLAVYDTCYNHVEQTIDFSVTEQALTLTSLPASFTLPDNQTAQTLLHTITWSDKAGDPVYCRYTGTDPFMLQPLSTTEYGLYVCEHPNFDAVSTPTYTLTITCTENRLNSVTNDVSGTVTIYVTQNLNPSITNLDASATVDAEAAKIGDVVFTVTTYDPEGDDITFTSTCTPAASCPLELRQNGEIQINSGLLFSPEYSYTLEVNIQDSHGNMDGPNYFLLTISNINNDASFTNLPLSVNLAIMENTPVDTTLYTILYSDRDITDTKIYTVTYSDDRLSRLFDLNPSTGVLTTAFNEIDYEAFTNPSTYTMTIALGDTKSDITETIDITFTNRNEAPRFLKDYFDITVEEGDDGFQLTDGTIFSNNVVDEDSNEPLNAESHTYSLDCESGTQTHRFYLNPDTAELTFKGPYDLDTGDTPNEVSCVITVTDKYGLTGTADIHIHVTNVNEFSPEFSQTSYTIYVQPNTLVGTSVLSVSADDLDADLDTDKEFFYTLDQSTLPGGTEYFHIDQKGRIYLVESLLAFSLGDALGTFTTVVTNPGNPVMSGTANVEVIIPGSTTTAAGTTTDRNKGFYEDYWNVIWLILVLGGIIIILLSISVVMFQIMRLRIIPIWCRNCWRNCSCCRPKPEPERGFGDRGYDLTSFGHEHKYTDDDDIDGWIRRQGGIKDTKVKLSGYQRFGTPSEKPFQKSYKEPVYELFRVPTPPQNQDRLDRTTPKVTWKRGMKF